MEVNGSPSHSYRMSLAMCDHTVLPSGHPTQVNIPRLNSSQRGWYSIYISQRYGKLNWPRWLVTYRDGLPAHRRSPIQVLTRQCMAGNQLTRKSRMLLLFV